MLVLELLWGNGKRLDNYVITHSIYSEETPKIRQLLEAIRDFRRHPIVLVLEETINMPPYVVIRECHKVDENIETLELAIPNDMQYSLDHMIYFYTDEYISWEFKNLSTTEKRIFKGACISVALSLTTYQANCSRIPAGKFPIWNIKDILLIRAEPIMKSCHEKIMGEEMIRLEIFIRILKESRKIAEASQPFITLHLPRAYSNMSKIIERFLKKVLSDWITTELSLVKPR